MSTRARSGFLALCLVASSGAHLWGIAHDLPIPAADERYFVQPAAYVAASGDLNPHWFGHPGSTVIYPLAAVYRVRELLFHGGPLIGPAPAIAARLHTDPGSFYLLGRLWALLFALGALPLVFAIGRRVFGDPVAVVATAIWAVVPLAVSYGRVTRTDSVAVFFALLALLCCLRTLERPTGKRFASAGVAAGLGTASRYFLASLAIVILATWLFAPGRRRGRTITAALGGMAVSFVVTTPFLFLDRHDALTSLRNESRSSDPAHAHGVLSNLVFYVGHAIPSAVSWVVFAAALGGIVLALRRRDHTRWLLLIWLALVLLTISLLSFRWDRWALPALPVVVLFAADGLIAAAREVARRAPSERTRTSVAVGALGVLTVAALAGPVTGVVARDRVAARPSTRTAAQRWIEHHLGSRAGVATEVNGPDLTETAYRSVEHHALPLAGTVADYARAHYRFLVVNDDIAAGYLGAPVRFPEQAAFYAYLREHALRVAIFRPTVAGGGAPLEVFDIATVRANAAAARSPAERTLAPAVHSHVRRGGAVPTVERSLRKLEHTAATRTRAGGGEWAVRNRRPPRGGARSTGSGSRARGSATSPSGGRSDRRNGSR